MGSFRMYLVAAALLLLGSVSAQDTHHCPDGWVWHEGHGGRGHCYLFSMEQLSKMNGEILCASHGGWIVEQSLRIATMTTSMETGGGLTPMPASSGSTGETT